MDKHYEYCLVAVIIAIPLTSISHFIEPLTSCILADICNHTWIPECANELSTDYRMFIDECDMLEYNCDYERNYTLANYSDCFAPQNQIKNTCPPVPTCPACPQCQMCRMGNWVFRDGRKMLYDPIATVPAYQRRLGHHNHQGHEGHNHFVEHIHLRNGYRGYGELPSNIGTARAPERTAGPGVPGGRRHRHKKYAKKTTTTTKRSKKKPKMRTKKTRKEKIKTATTNSMLRRNKFTFKKNGQMHQKVNQYLTTRKHGKIKLVNAISKNITKNATTSSMIYSSKFTFKKNGKIFKKVIKYYTTPKSGVIKHINNTIAADEGDSDFIEK